MGDFFFPERFEDEEAVGSFIHNCCHPMWIFDRETLGFLEVNQAAVRIYGYSREEFLTFTVLDIRPTNDVRSFLQQEVLHHHSSTTPEPWIHVRRDKTPMLVSITSREMTYRKRPVEVVMAIPREREGLYQSTEMATWRRGAGCVDGEV